MIKKSLIAIAALMLVSALFFVGESNAQTTTVKINPSTQTFDDLEIGDTITVNISIVDASNVWGWVASMYWDPNVLILNSNATEGPFLKTGGSALFFCAVTNETPPGQINEVSGTLLSSSGASGSGDLAKVTFKIVGYGTTNIGFNSTILSPELDSSAAYGHRELPHTDINGTIIVQQPTTSPTPTTTPTATPSSSVEPTTSPTASPSTSPTNTVAPTNSPSASPTPTADGLSFEIIAIIAGGIVLVLVLFSALFLQRRHK